jgi:methylase of polypeptide subunit release factors
MDPSDEALLELLAALRAEHYAFTSVTPATHARVVSRRAEARSLRDVFGWSLPFSAQAIPAGYVDILRRAKALERRGEGFRSTVRVSTLGDELFLHSAYPTSSSDAVFFGPDTYRYAALLGAELPALGPIERIVDIGAGSGAGGIIAAKLAPIGRVTLTDVNPAALRLSAVNSAFAGVDVERVEGPGLDAVKGNVDLVIANPPYVMDEEDRAYRNGGGMHGAQISLDWALAAAERLQPGGCMILYTGVAIIEGEDALRAALEGELPALGCSLRYRELDPDIFGEELDRPAYRDADRIAAVAAVIAKA